MDDTLLPCLSLKQPAEVGGADDHLLLERHQNTNPTKSRVVLGTILYLLSDVKLKPLYKTFERCIDEVATWYMDSLGSSVNLWSGQIET